MSVLTLVGRLFEPADSAVELSDTAVQRVCDGGLGPLYQALQQQGQINCSEAGRNLLQGADLTARVVSARSAEATGQVLDVLEGIQCRPALLKGSDMACRYYPEPHWRVMADVDVLVCPDSSPAAVAALKEAGFHYRGDDPAERWSDHHHAEPLYHPTLKIWVEIHHRLITDQSPFRHEPLLNGADVFDGQERAPLAGGEARVLRSDIAFAHTLAHWYFDLIDRWGRVGLQRPLLDCFFMLQADTSLPMPAQMSVELRVAAGLLTGLLRALGARRLPDVPATPLPWPVADHLSSLLQMQTPKSDFRALTAGAAFYRLLVARSRPGFATGLARDWLAILTDTLRYRMTGSHRQHL